MAASYPRKRSRIRGISTVKRALPVQILAPGQRKPRQEFWHITDTDVSDQPITATFPTDLHTASNNQHGMANFDEVPIKIETNYRKYKKKRNDKWNELRPIVARALIEEEALGSSECSICQEECFDKIVRCLDCGPMAFFCPDCCRQQHSFIALHKPQEWKDGHFLPFPLPFVILGRVDHECGLDYTKCILLVDNKGRPHLQSFRFCQCEEEVVTLVRLGFWPATPLRPSIAISIELLETLRALVFTGHLSLTAFTASLRYRYESQYSKHPDVFKVFTWDMILNFNVVYHQVHNLEEVCPDITPTEVCPACPKDTKVIAMDGNFSLVRRRRHGSSTEATERHPSRFFLPQKNVDEFVESYSESSSQTKECSNFQAGSILRTKNKNEKLEVKGIFGSVCRHDYPYKFFDMKHGERMAYPVYLFNEIKGTTRMLLYDIACQMKSHLEKRIEIPEELVFAVPIFHVYGHQMHCQVLYNPRRIEGAGLCDGEGTERMWSFLGDFSNITKEMTSENRHDFLTEVLLQYSTKLTNNMVKSLMQKMEKACLILATTEGELTEIVSSFPGGVTRENIYKWSKAEVDRQLQKKISGTEDWKDQYAILLHDYYSQSEQFNGDDLPEDELDDKAMELARMETKMRRIEKRQKMKRWDKDSLQYAQDVCAACEKKRKSLLLEMRDKVIEYIFLCYMRKKYSDGQSLAKRLTKQVVASSKKVDTSINKYNDSPMYGEQPTKVKRQDAMKLDSDVYTQVLDPDDQLVDPQIPSTTKRKAVDILNLNARAREEVQFVSQDILQFKSAVAERERILRAKIADLSDEEYLDQYQIGSMSVIKTALSDLERVKSTLEENFAPVLSNRELSINDFLDHVQVIDSSNVEEFNSEELRAILEEIEMFEREGQEEELEEQYWDTVRSA